MISVTIDGISCLNPQVFYNNVASLAATRSRQWIDIASRVQLASLVNRFIDVAGPGSSYGYFAVNRALVDKVKSKNNIKLIFGHDQFKKEYENLVFVRATGMAPIAPQTKSGADAFVLELADRRYFGNHAWMKLDHDAQNMFNVPAPSYGVDQFYTDTVNSETGLPWTWQEMINELWPSFLGTTVPTLPASLTDQLTAKPVGMDFRNFTAYQSLQIVLNHLNVDMVLRKTGYEFVETGAIDDQTTDNDQLINMFSGAYDEEIEFIEPVKTNYPRGVKVYFQKTASNSGAESTITKENGQWYCDMHHIETVEVTSAQLAANDISKTLNSYQQIYDDLPAWVDPFSGEIANQAEITARAALRMKNYYRSLVKDSLRAHASYSHMVPFKTCGTMSAISWVQQLRRGGAWSTEYWCHPRMQASISGGSIVPATIQPVSPWQWRSAPIYPPDILLVRNDGFLSSGSASGTNDDEYNMTNIRYNAATKQFVSDVYLKGVQHP